MTDSASLCQQNEDFSLFTNLTDKIESIDLNEAETNFSKKGLDMDKARRFI